MKSLDLKSRTKVLLQSWKDANLADKKQIKENFKNICSLKRLRVEIVSISTSILTIMGVLFFAKSTTELFINQTNNPISGSFKDFHKNILECLNIFQANPIKSFLMVLGAFLITGFILDLLRKTSVKIPLLTTTTLLFLWLIFS